MCCCCAARGSKKRGLLLAATFFTFAWKRNAVVPCPPLHDLRPNLSPTPKATGGRNGRGATKGPGGTSASWSPPPCS